MSNKKDLEDIGKWLRRSIIEMTTKAGSGHPTSSLSSVELMSVLFFGASGFFRYDVSDPENRENDRLIFSKGHASPLFYALWAIAGGIDRKELETFRKFGSSLEGHPTRALSFVEVPTGSLGQGLAVGIGEALAMRSMKCEMRNAGSKNQEGKFQTSDLKSQDPKVFVLLGDSELSEGSVWESARIALHYRLGNLIVIVDVNRLGQSNETMDGWDVEKIAQRFEAFGWRSICVDGHSIEAIASAYEMAGSGSEIPTAIIAKTIKGKGVSFLEDKEGWHGKSLSKEECEKALFEIGEVDDNMKGVLQKPITHDLQPTMENGEQSIDKRNLTSHFQLPTSLSSSTLHVTRYTLGEMVSPRSAYGKALVETAMMDDRIVALDAEVKNSTYSGDFEKVFPDRFYEMFIAEQTMVGVATGIARRGYTPFVSTFSAFFTRAFDQIRMASYADVPLVCVGSHCGVSIGEDGASQMGLEDIAMFRSVLGSVVFYPGDANAMRACVRLASNQKGITYIRSTRAELPVLYKENEKFAAGGSKTLRESDQDSATIVASGITLHEALKAYDILQKEGVSVRVIDAYSVKPIDTEVIQKAVRETGKIIVVEDHFAEGGLADAVREAVNSEQVTGDREIQVISLAVRKRPRSGTPEELLRYEEIDAEAIVKLI